MFHSAAVQPADSAARGKFVLLAPLLARRGWCIWITVAALTHLVLAHAAWLDLGCTIQTLTGHPCPGCGLTKATLALLHGRWLEALATHPAAPLFAVALGVIFGAAALPERARHRLVRVVTRAERQVPIATLGGLVLLGYWCIRIF